MQDEGDVRTRAAGGCARRGVAIREAWISRCVRQEVAISETMITTFTKELLSVKPNFVLCSARQSRVCEILGRCADYHPAFSSFVTPAFYAGSSLSPRPFLLSFFLLFPKGHPKVAHRSTKGDTEVDQRYTKGRGNYNHTFSIL